MKIFENRRKLEYLEENIIVNNLSSRLDLIEMPVEMWLL